MKKKIILGVILSAFAFMPLVNVNASIKTDKIVEDLKELAKSFDGRVNYEYDNIEIEWETQNSKSNEIEFTYSGNVIQFDAGNIESYEEAQNATSHYIYFLDLIKAALRVNGYSEKEITDFFNDENSSFNFEKNGIEFKETGEEKKYTSPDGTITTTVTPMSIKIDVTKANLSLDGNFEQTTSTIEDIVEYLQSDKSFTSSEYDGKVVYENEINNEDDTITIYNTYYWDDYHNVRFETQDDIITYEDDNIENYSDAENASSHQMFMLQILMYALKENGYSNEEIQEYISQENNSFDYEINGIEYKESGESKEYTSDDGTSTITISPVLIKVDLKRANLNKTITTNKVLDGENQKANTGKDLTFRFDIDYATFNESGRVYIDDELLSTEYYLVKEGSTIVTISKDYLSDLSNEEHTIKVLVKGGKSETKFTLTNETSVVDTKVDTLKNPQTADNIFNYIALLKISIVGFIGVLLYTKKSILN